MRWIAATARLGAEGLTCTVLGRHQQQYRAAARQRLHIGGLQEVIGQGDRQPRRCHGFGSRHRPALSGSATGFSGLVTGLSGSLTGAGVPHRD